MTVIAELDLMQDPAVVITLYDYGGDTIPPHMVPPEFVDVTGEDPRPQPGYTYDGEAFAPGEPQAFEQARQELADDAESWVEANRAYEAIEEPSAGDLAAQVLALTEQTRTLLELELRRFGRPA